MALRIARGFLRLWLVLSVLWIGAVIAVATLNFPAADPWAKFNPQPSAQQQSDSLPDAPWVIEAAANRQRAIQTATEIALIPPVLLLMIGSALGWALRGFR